MESMILWGPPSTLLEAMHPALALSACDAPPIVSCILESTDSRTRATRGGRHAGSLPADVAASAARLYWPATALEEHPSHTLSHGDVQDTSAPHQRSSAPRNPPPLRRFALALGTISQLERIHRCHTLGTHARHQLVAVPALTTHIRLGTLRGRHGPASCPDSPAQVPPPVRCDGATTPAATFPLQRRDCGSARGVSADQERTDGCAQDKKIMSAPSNPMNPGPERSEIDDTLSSFLRCRQRCWGWQGLCRTYRRCLQGSCVHESGK